MTVTNDLSTNKTLNSVQEDHDLEDLEEEKKGVFQFNEGQSLEHPLEVPEKEAMDHIYE